MAIVFILDGVVRKILDLIPMVSPSPTPTSTEHCCNDKFKPIFQIQPNCNQNLLIALPKRFKESQKNKRSNQFYDHRIVKLPKKEIQKLI